MKNKLFGLILAVALCASCVLTACNGDKNKSFFAFMVGGEPTYIDIDASKFEDKFVIDVLNSQEYSEEFNADISESEWGAFINSIFGIVPNSENGEYIAIYSTLSDFSMGSEYQITVDDRVFYSANVGVDELPVVKGAYYLFKLDVFVWDGDAFSVIEGAFA